MFSNFAYFSIYGLIQQMSHYLPNQSSKKGAVKYYISMIPKCWRSPTPHVCISKINMPLDILPPKKTMLCFVVDPIKCGLNIEFKTSLVKTKFNATFISTNWRIYMTFFLMKKLLSQIWPFRIYISTKWSIILTNLANYVPICKYARRAQKNIRGGRGVLKNFVMGGAGILGGGGQPPIFDSPAHLM